MTATSRAPSLSTIVRRALAGDAAPGKNGAIVVAVSGGPDSMALLEVLARLARTPSAARLDVRAHGVDHGLRAEAAGELDLAEAFARRLGVPFERTRVVVPPGGNLQARARVARWKALADAARKHDAAVATAHHADDRAETLVMRLLRGAGLRGLAVLPPRATALGAPDVTVIRPLIRARRADVVAHLARRAVPHASDPSNDDPRYLRTRVRHRLLPLLVELDPRIVSHLESIADELVSDLGVPATPIADGSGWTRGLPRPTQTALAALARSRSPSARVWLPGGLVAIAAPVPPRDPPPSPPPSQRNPKTSHKTKQTPPEAKARLPAEKPSG